MGFNDWDATLDVWKSGQTLLPKVTRWSKYVKDDDPYGGGRVQDTLQHSYSLSLLGEILLLTLKKHNHTYDHHLFLTACLLHDHGEGELERDILYVDKSSDEDLNEYKAFQKRFGTLDKDIYEPLEQAFLLQFAQLEDNEAAKFPEEAKKQMEYLKQNKHLEILAFEALERWDYVLYALEQYKDRQNERILVRVLRNQAPHLDRLADELPGFKEEIWNEKIRHWAEDFMARRDGKWLEQKGEV